MRLRRLLAALTVAVALVASGCGATGHAVGGVVAHHAANHVVGRRNAGKIFCLYHGHRVIVDLRTHHRIAAAFNAYEAYKSCQAGFGHRCH